VVGVCLKVLCFVCIALYNPMFIISYLFHNTCAREIFIGAYTSKTILTGVKKRFLDYENYDTVLKHGGEVGERVRKGIALRKYLLWSVTIVFIFWALLVACNSSSEEKCTANCTPPTNSITLTVSPISVTTAGNITLSATVTGNINKVRFLKNGTAFSETNTASTVTAVVPITATDNGTVTLKAEGLSSSHTVLASDEARITVAIHASIKDIRTSAGIGSITVEWTFEGDETSINGFQIFRATEGGAFLPLNDANPSARSFTDTGLDSAKTYRYGLAIIDSNGTVSPRLDQAGNGTQPLPPGQQPGTVELVVTPVSPITVAGNVTLTASVTGGVTKVRFLRDGVALGAVDSSEPFTTGVQLSAEDNGTVTFRAEGLNDSDTVLSSSEVQVIVSINTPPPVSSIALAVSPTTVNTAGEVDLNATVTGEITKVRFLKHGVALGAVDASAPFAAKVNLTEADNGTVTFTAEGLNPSDEVVSTSNEIPVTVNIQPSGWQQMGGSLGAGANPSLASNGTTTVVAFEESTGSVTNIRVYRWNGSTWVNVGGPLSGSSIEDSNATVPSLAVDGNGNPTVAWYEAVGEGGNIYVQKFNGSSWWSVGTEVISVIGRDGDDGSSYPPSLALDSNGNPILAWSDYNSDGNEKIYVRKFDGISWVNVGSGELGTDYGTVRRVWNSVPILALDNNGNPAVAWLENDSGDLMIDAARFTNNNWTPSGYVSSRGYASSLALTLDSRGKPFVAWHEYALSNIYVKSFDSGFWQNVGSGELNATGS
jgi:hypothetical protein